MSNENKYNLKERIVQFVLEVIALARDLPDNRVNRIFIDQIIRSVSGIGSNYEEADGTPTKRDFIYRMGVVKKEAKETKYWLGLIKLTNCEKFFVRIERLLRENEELIRIFASIIIKSKS